MGLFDLLFNKKKTGKNTDYGIHENQDNVKQGYILTTKIDIGTEYYEQLHKCFIAFDTETTGGSIERDEIIEVGAVKFVNGEAVESYGSLVNVDVPIPDRVCRITHISNEMLKKQGKAPEIVYSELMEFFGDALTGGTYLCAHNASFDMSFLSKTLEQYGYSGNIQCIDTLTFSKKMIQGLPNYKQDTVAKHFNICNKEAHRAVTDG